jgi:hypothetical protein
LNLKESIGGTSSNNKSIKFNIGLNDNYHIANELKIEITNNDYFNMTFGQIFEIEKSRKNIDYFKVISIFSKPPNYISVNGLKTTEILEKTPLDFAGDTTNITIKLSKIEETEYIIEFKSHLEEITNNQERNLIYISIGSFLNGNDSIDEIINQQFLPKKLSNLLQNFDKTYIFLIDEGFKKNADLNKSNLIDRKEEVLNKLNLSVYSSKITIQIIGSNVPGMASFSESLKKYVNEKNDIYVSFIGQHLEQIT